jgi:hypothetical protein
MLGTHFLNVSVIANMIAEKLANQATSVHIWTYVAQVPEKRAKLLFVMQQRIVYFF